MINKRLRWLCIPAAAGLCFALAACSGKPRDDSKRDAKQQETQEMLETTAEKTRAGTPAAEAEAGEESSAGDKETKGAVIAKRTEEAEQTEQAEETTGESEAIRLPIKTTTQQADKSDAGEAATEDEAAAPTSAAEAGDKSSQTGQQDTPVTTQAAEAVLSISYAPQELMADRNAYDYYIIYDGDYCVDVKIETNVTVRDFQVNTLIADASGDQITFSIEHVLYEQAKLSPDRPFVTTLVFEGSMPEFGISYTDTNGARRSFYLAQSGEDGSPLLVQY